MGGYGSGRSGGRLTVESALRLDIDQLMRNKVIVLGAFVFGRMQFEFYDQTLMIEFESRLQRPGNSWLRLKYAILNYHSGEEHQIDDRILLIASKPPFGGMRWWFECPRSGRKARVLHLPLGGRHFCSRRVYRLTYASQRDTVYDRALRRSRKLCIRLGADPADNDYPEKPKRMRWTTYNSIIGRISAADRIADKRLVRLLARWSPR